MVCVPNEVAKFKLFRTRVMCNILYSLHLLTCFNITFSCHVLTFQEHQVVIKAL